MAWFIKTILSENVVFFFFNHLFILFPYIFHQASLCHQIFHIYISFFNKLLLVYTCIATYAAVEHDHFIIFHVRLVLNGNFLKKCLGIGLNRLNYTQVKGKQWIFCFINMIILLYMNPLIWKLMDK